MTDHQEQQACEDSTLHSWAVPERQLTKDGNTDMLEDILRHFKIQLQHDKITTLQKDIKIDLYIQSYLLTQQIHIWSGQFFRQLLRRRPWQYRQTMLVKTFLSLPAEEKEMRHAGNTDSYPSAKQRIIMMA